MIEREALISIVARLASLTYDIQEDQILCTLSNEKLYVTLLFDPQQQVPDTSHLQEFVRSHFSSAGVGSVEFVAYAKSYGKATPSKVLLFSQVHAPCSASKLAKVLEREDGKHYEVSYLHRVLERLRKDGLLIYVGEEEFSPSVAGIRLAAKMRSGKKDVPRVLHFGRAEEVP